MTRDWGVNLGRREDARAATASLMAPSTGPFDVVATYNEVNDRHGTGQIVQQLFDSDRSLSIRAQTQFGGEQAFGARQLVIPEGLDRAGIHRWVLGATDGIQIERVVCVPWESTELIAAIALRDALQVPFCLYVMDDHNITIQAIPDALMDEALSKASVRLAISPDMREAYESKFARRFWLAPPTIPAGLRPRPRVAPEPASAVILGNFWGQSWFEAMRQAMRGSGIKADWFTRAQNGGFWLDVPDRAELERDSIHMCDPVSNEELADRLAGYEVALLPTRPSDTLENVSVAKFSLPSRVAFLIGASDIPIIALGDPSTCLARFVAHHSLGLVVPYNSAALRHAVARLRDDSVRRERERSIAELRRTLTVENTVAWARATIDRGKPPHGCRLQSLEIRPTLGIRRHIDETPPLDPWLHGYQATYAACQRLWAAGFRPEFVIDVGASTGVWSQVASRIFGDARYVLIDPLFERYDRQAIEHCIGGLKEASMHEFAVGAAPDHLPFHVGRLYNATLYDGMAERSDGEDPVDVEVRTLDSLAAELDLCGRGLLKLDIQGAEVAALEGGRELLAEHVDVVIVEATLYTAGACPDSSELDHRLRAAGFIWFDILDDWRDSELGLLLQVDLMYVRADSPMAELRRPR